VYKILCSILCIALISCSDKIPIEIQKRLDERHLSCKVAVSYLQIYIKKIQYKKEHGNSKFQQIGDCEAKHIRDNLWFVKGYWLNIAMGLDGIAQINFEAVMFEDNNQRDLAVKRYGTQYTFCGVAINGKDASGIVRYVNCEDGGDIMEFKIKHGL